MWLSPCSARCQGVATLRIVVVIHVLGGQHKLADCQQFRSDRPVSPAFELLFVSLDLLIERCLLDKQFLLVVQFVA